MALYRCTKCRQRRALPRPVEDYIRKPKCLNSSCKELLTYRDTWQEKQNAKTKCHCDGAPYPHREGSMLFCVHSTKQPTHEQYANYYNVAP